ncbi:MAG: YfhO family protein, partial [Candidatus Andersenbacteria bacterium]
MKRLYQRGIKWLQEHRIPLGLFLVTILIFFGRTIFLQQFYFFGDLKVMFYPLESEYSTFQNQWSLPQWSSHFGFGQPLMAWAQIGFFTPVHLILRVFQLHALVLIHLSMAIHFLIGLIGMYCFMRKRDVSTLGAFLAAIVFVFNGYTIYHLVHVNFFVATMWIPWLLLAIDAWFQKPKGYWLSMMSLLSAFMLLSGHLQLVLYCLIVVLLWAIVLLIAHWRLEMRWLLRVSLSALLVLALTAGLSSLALFPIYEFLPDNDRRGGYTEEEFYVFSFPPHHAITLVLPSFFGSQGNYKGAKSEQELGSYVGIIPLLLAGLACIRYKYIFSQRTQQRILLIYAVILFVVSVAFALGQYSPVYRWLVDAQLFPAFTAPGRFLIFFATAIAILAGIGCDVVPTLARRAYRSHLFWQLGPILLASVITIVPLGSKMGTDSAFLQAVKNLPALPPLELASALLGLCLWGALWMIRH